MSCWRTLALIAIGMMATPNLLAQEMRVNWTRNAFEAGVRYDENDQLAQATLTCPPYGWAADVLATNVQWAPDTQPETVKNGAIWNSVPYKGANRALVANGTSPIFADAHIFPSDTIGKTVPVLIGVRMHCLDETTPYTDYPGLEQITIYDRIPVNSVRTSVPTVSGGQSFEVTVTISAPAPSSNTRIDLNWTGDGAALLVSPPKTIDVPAKRTDVTFKVTTNKSNGPVNRTLAIAASTKGQPQQTSLTISK